MILDSMSAIVYLLQMKFGDFKALVRSHRDFRKFKNKLKVSESRKMPSELNGFYKKSILLDYFVRGKRKFSEVWKN